MFYDLFKTLCDGKGVSVSRACIEMGLSRSIAAKWKNTQTNPSADVLPKIARYFDVTTDYLLTGEEKEKAPTPEGERKIDITQAKIALFGGDGEVTDEMWEEAIFAAQLIKDRHKRKKD